MSKEDIKAFNEARINKMDKENTCFVWAIRLDNNMLARFITAFGCMYWN